MNILEALVKLRDDLKTWVANNLKALDSKIEKNIVSIDSELSTKSTNPVQNKIITNAINSLPRDYSDLANAPNIIEDESGEIAFADEAGNIIFKADADGIHSTSLTLNGEDIKVLLEQKVDKEKGKGLSSNDYTDEDKAKLSLISDDIVSATIDSELSTTSDNPVKNKVITNALNNIDYNNLVNAPNIDENGTGELAIADESGNIILKVDATGTETTTITAKNVIVNGMDVMATISQHETDIENLETLVGDTAVATQISNAVSKIESFSGDYGDLVNAPNITEDNSDSVVIADDNGYVVAKVDSDGIHANSLILNGENVLNRINIKFNEITETMENYDRLRTGLIPMGIKIEADTELNSIAMIKVGSYYCTPNTTVATLINCPTLHAFIMQVYSPISTKIDNEEIDVWVYRVRKILDYEGNEYTQVVYSNATAGEFYFKNWEQVAKTGYIDDKLSSKLDKSPFSIELNANGGLNNYGGFIDFHYHDANGAETGNTDYSSRIIEGSQGIISINNVDFNIADASMQAATIRVKAQQAISDSVVRNSKLVTTETNPTVNGEICWVYE